MMLYKKIFLNETASTHEQLKSMVESGQADDGLVVQTAFQHAGKGLAENKWFSSPNKNLLCSIGRKLDFVEAGKQFLISKAVSMAVYQVVAELVADLAALRIKWPNDIYVGDRKLGGMLITHIVSGQMLTYTIIGIGINLNEESFPDEIPNPVSLLQLTGMHTQPGLVLDVLLQKLDEAIELMRSDEALLNKIYLNHLLRYQEWAPYLVKGVEKEAIIRGVNEFGFLMLETRNAELLALDLKEVAFRF